MPNPYSFPALNLLRQATVTLTNAQIKALPTTRVTLVPASGVGRIVLPALAKAVLTFNWAGNYANVDLSAQMEVSLFNSEGNGIDWLLVPSHFKLLDFFTWGAQITWQVNPQEVSTVGGTANNTVMQANFPLQLRVLNASLGNFTGGHPNNTLDISLLYSVYDLSLKQFI